MYINVLVHAKQKCFMHLKLISNNDDDGNQKSQIPHYNINRAGEKKAEVADGCLDTTLCFNFAICPDKNIPILPFLGILNIRT